MIHLSIHINGGKKVQDQLDKGTKLSRALGPAMKHAVLYAQSEIPAYPPASLDSSYRRTGTLGRSVTSMQGQAPGALSRVESLGSHTVGYLGTNVTYAPWVIDDNRQAYMHRGRWWTLQKVVQKAKPGIIKILRKSILDHLGM